MGSDGIQGRLDSSIANGGNGIDIAEASAVKLPEPSMDGEDEELL